MLILRSTHARILAQGQEEARRVIAKANDERDGARASRDEWMRIATRRDRRSKQLQAENADLRAKLERFTAPRKRDARGHFLPAEKVS